MIEQEVRLVAAEAGVPAEEAVASLGQVARQVVLGKVHVVVRGDEGGRRPLPGRAMVDALARVAAGAGPADDRGRQRDELPDDLGHWHLPGGVL